MVTPASAHKKTGAHVEGHRGPGPVHKNNNVQGRSYSRWSQAKCAGERYHTQRYWDLALMLQGYHTF